MKAQKNATNKQKEKKTASLTIGTQISSMFQAKSMRQPQIHDVIAYLHYLQYVDEKYLKNINKHKTNKQQQSNKKKRKKHQPSHTNKIPLQ